MSKKNKKQKLGHLYYHEALDRTSVVIDIIDDHIAMHPVIQNHKKLRKKVYKALDLLGDVYQAVGMAADRNDDESLKKARQCLGLNI